MTDKVEREDFIIKKSISFYDLRSFGFEFEVSEDNILLKCEHNGVVLKPAQINVLLFTLGLDTQEDNYKVEGPQLHRTSNFGVKPDFRFTCKERSDKEWIATGKASDETQIKYGSKFKDLSSELSKLSRRANYLGQ